MDLREFAPRPWGTYSRLAVSVAAFALGSSLAAQDAPAVAQGNQKEAESVLASPELAEPALRQTIVPWIVDVYGRNYQDFTNIGASRVISDWMTNALIDLDLFNIVNRERIRAVLSERNLELSGYARDVSRDVPENELATAGKLLSVNYILLGNVKNLGASSEIDFKLLDVETTTYSQVFRLNFHVPFNPSIEKFKPVIDRIIAELASSFPVLAEIQGLGPEGHLVLAAGSKRGLVEGLSAELWSRWEARPLGSGVLTSVGPYTSEMVMDEWVPVLAYSDFYARIAVKPGPEAVLASARLELKRGDYAKARDLLASGIDSYPDHSRILSLHAHSCWRLGDYAAAVSSYRDALKAEPNDLELLEEAARVLFEAGHFQEVVRLLSADSRPQLTIDLELLQGNSLALQGYPGQAREAFKRAFRLDPENPIPHLRIALLAARAGQLQEMQRELRLARASGGDALEVQLAFLIAEGLLSEPPSVDAARELIGRALEGGDFSSLATAAQLFVIEPSMWREALDLAERSVQLNPSFLLGHMLRADAFVLGGELAQAIEVLEHALSQQPNNVALLVRAGELHAAAGDYSKAELRLLQAMDLAPLDWRAAEVLGDGYEKQGQYLKAVDAYQTSLAIAEQADGPNLTVMLRKLGRAAVLGEQHGTALPYLERCVEREPDNKECRYYLGLCHHNANLAESNERAIVNLRASEGFSNDAYYYLGTLFDRREEFLTAVEWYQRCVDTDCSQAKVAQKRVDDIETIRGTIIGQIRGVKELNLDVGAIHGVLPSQIATVVHQGKVIGKLRVEQVLEKTSVAKIQRGEPRTGHTVVFRPRRPRGLVAEKATKKGVLLRWQRTFDPGLSAVVVLRRDDTKPGWRERRSVNPRESSFVDKTAKPGHNYSYRLKAVTDQKQESLLSRVCEISLP